MEDYNTVIIPYNEFFEYFLSDIDLWSEWYAKEVFAPYIEDDCIAIDYKYVDDPIKISFKWRVSNLDDNRIDETTGKIKCSHRIRKARYLGSSPFALWWSNFTDE